ncbi:unnamed protein product, partial [Laminaria digitata]
MRPAAWALLAVQQNVGLSFHIGRVLPPRVDVRGDGFSGRIGQAVPRPGKSLRTFPWTTAASAAAALASRVKGAQVGPLRVWSEDE